MELISIVLIVVLVGFGIWVAVHQVMVNAKNRVLGHNVENPEDFYEKTPNWRR